MKGIVREVVKEYFLRTLVVTIVFWVPALLLFSMHGAKAAEDVLHLFTFYCLSVLSIPFYMGCGNETA